MNEIEWKFSKLYYNVHKRSKCTANNEVSLHTIGVSPYLVA